MCSFCLNRCVVLAKQPRRSSAKLHLYFRITSQKILQHQSLISWVPPAIYLRTQKSIMVENWRKIFREVARPPFWFRIPGKRGSSPTALINQKNKKDRANKKTEKIALLCIPVAPVCIIFCPVPMFSKCSILKMDLIGKNLLESESEVTIENRFPRTSNSLA